MTLAADTAFLIPGRALGRVAGSIRYAGVLAVWMGLLLIRPKLALTIFRERRADSPLRRRAGNSEQAPRNSPTRRVL